MGRRSLLSAWTLFLAFLTLVVLILPQRATGLQPRPSGNGPPSGQGPRARAMAALPILVSLAAVLMAAAVIAAATSLRSP